MSGLLRPVQFVFFCNPDQRRHWQPRSHFATAYDLSTQVLHLISVFSRRLRVTMDSAAKPIKEINRQAQLTLGLFNSRIGYQMSISSELREWRKAVAELIADKTKKYRKAPIWAWVLVILGFLYAILR